MPYSNRFLAYKSFWLTRRGKSAVNNLAFSPLFSYNFLAYIAGITLKDYDVMAQDLYKILGIEKGASESEIKKAYRKIAQKNHPDKNPGDSSAEKKFKEATAAYEILSDKQKKQQYDTFGGAGGSGFGGGRPGGGGFQGANFSQGFDFSDLGGFADVFESFFGGGGGARSSGRRNAPRRGNDIEAVVQLEFMEAVNGATRELEITKPVVCDTCTGKRVAPGSKMKTCNICGGSGQVRKVQNTMLGQVNTVASCDTCAGAGEIPEKVCGTCNGASRVQKSEKLSVKIPAGVDTGSAIRLAGKGEGGINGGPAGNLFIHVQVKEDPFFKRSGSDIYTTEKINLIQAVLGDEIETKTAHGKVTLKIPAGTQSHKSFKLSGHGLAKPGGTKQGDQYIEVHVEIPKKLSKKETKLYEELANEGGLDLKGKKGLFG